ncbi:ATP-binding protein [Lachnobacterium bovis]|uniref:DNA replication protein DnaC n=1 Tax=Lachnobacterium bovis DSM 14045 TaxID=1122142 RepID=A0A1H3IM02_9FIRM|nr:ATP-binding protein [Lachnobacterium bovis]SDY28721.1 DNA replication protein DnaC [Lachnobacterium bovis DSM 14045]
MSISNTQYDTIMRTYNAQQLKNQHEFENRQKEVYAKIPEIQEIDHAVSSASISAARKRLNGDMDSVKELKEQIKTYNSKRHELLRLNSYPDDYLEIKYKCNDCKDTGYINGKQCRCFKQKVIDLVYSQSNIKDSIANESFSDFSMDFYSDKQIDPSSNMSSYALASMAYQRSLEFVSEFENIHPNVLFYGNTGVGKTFLSNCIAESLLRKGHSVLYFTAYQLFETLSSGVFSRDSAAISNNKSIFDCDLLIIDDLGTELTNTFTNSQLFLCVNERLLRKKSTIISTNLSPNQLIDTYSERTFSRIINNYSILKLFGEDIRMKKRNIT